jgi:hypothetical protein
VSLQLSAKSVGLFEAFYSSIRPVQLLDYAAELQGARTRTRTGTRTGTGTRIPTRTLALALALATHPG